MSDTAHPGAGNPPATTFDPGEITNSKDAFAILSRVGSPAQNAPASPSPAPQPAQAPAAPAAPATETPEPAAAPEASKPPATPTEGATPQETPSAEEEDEAAAPGKPKKYRLRAEDPREEAVYVLRKAGVPFDEAVRRIYGDPKATESQPKEPEAQPPAADPFAAEEARIKQEIAELEKQIPKAKEDVSVEDAIAITRAIASKERALDRIADRREAAAREAQSQHQQVVLSKEQEDFNSVVKRYPSLAEKSNPERIAFETFVQQKTADPDYQSVFQSPRWRSILAREFAEQGGIKPPAPPAPPPSTPSTPKPVIPPAPPRTPNASTVLTTREAAPPGTSFEVTPEQIQRELANLGPEDLPIAMALLRGDKTPPALRKRK